MELVDKAQRARHVAATRLNRRSSRSHALVLLSLEQRIPVVPSAPTPRALDTPAAFATAAPKPARPFGAGLRGPPAGAMSPVASLSFCAGPQQHAGDDGPATPDMFKLGGAKPANHQGLDMFGTPPAFGPMGLATPGPAHGSSKSVAWGGAGTCAARGQQQRTVLPTCTRILRSKLYLVDLAGKGGGVGPRTGTGAYEALAYTVSPCGGRAHRVRPPPPVALRACRQREAGGRCV